MKTASHPARAFTLIELLVVVAIIAILASLLLPTLGRAKQQGQLTSCVSNLKQIAAAFQSYLGDAQDHFPDRRDLKASLPGGYHPWSASIWPPSDPRAGWAAVEFQPWVTPAVWSCPTALNSPVGNAVETLQACSTDTNVPEARYWTWRFDRTNDMSTGQMLEDFWGKSIALALADLESTNDPLLGTIHGPADAVLTEDAYYPKTTPTVDPSLKGRTIHPGTGRNRMYLDGHTLFYKDARTPRF